MAMYLMLGWHAGSHCQAMLIIFRLGPVLVACGLQVAQRGFGVLNSYGSHIFVSRIDPQALRQMLQHGPVHIDFLNLLRHSPGQYRVTDKLWVSRVYSDSGPAAEVRCAYRAFAKITLQWYQALEESKQVSSCIQSTSTALF